MSGFQPLGVQTKALYGPARLLGAIAAVIQAATNRVAQNGEPVGHLVPILRPSVTVVMIWSLTPKGPFVCRASVKGAEAGLEYDVVRARRPILS